MPETAKVMTKKHFEPKIEEVGKRVLKISEKANFA